MLARTLAVSLTVALLTLLGATAATAASYPHERDGMVLGFNVGGGSAGVNDNNGSSSNREGGFAGNFRVAYAFSPQVAAGLEGNVWTKTVDNQTWTFSVGGPALTYYPGATGFFIRGGIGVGTADFSVDNGGTTVSVSDNGFGFLLGTGYEWRLGHKFALGPQFDYAHAKVNDNFSMNYFNFTAGLNWYF